MDHGYLHADQYLAFCERRNATEPEKKFSLSFALDMWAARLLPGSLRSAIGTSPRCLIEGSASSGNIEALHQFLEGQGIDAPEIHVIDLIDLQELGYLDPRAHFHCANAADLGAVVADGTVDLLLQDHMMNCAPVALYGSILSEVRRVLSNRGVALLHYTDPSLFPAVAATPVGAVLADGEAHYTSAISRDELVRLSTVERLIPTAHGYSMITRPLGNLEHFVPFATFSKYLQEAGLEIRRHYTVDIVDSEGLDCRRNHCLVRPCRN